MVDSSAHKAAANDQKNCFPFVPIFHYILPMVLLAVLLAGAWLSQHYLHVAALFAGPASERGKANVAFVGPNETRSTLLDLNESEWELLVPNERERDMMQKQFFRRKVYAIDMSAVRHAKRNLLLLRGITKRSEPNRTRAVSKIAFLFLLTDRVEQEAVWEAFFQAANPSLFTIYIHRSEPRSGVGSFQGIPNIVSVPHTGSTWCALMGVQIAALIEALKDPANQQFVFVSQNTVPLKHFDRVYRSLAHSSVHTSKFCFATGTDHRGDCRFRDTNRNRGVRVVKHHQWIVLARRHAQALVDGVEQALEVYDDLRNMRAGQFKDPKMCSDESVPVLTILRSKGLGASIGKTSTRGDTLWQDLHDLGVEQRCTTFAYWSRCMNGSSLQLPSADEEEGLHPHGFDTMGADYLQKLVRSPFLFARKFPLHANVTNGTGPGVLLRKVLPGLWTREQVQGHVRGVARLDAGFGEDSF